MLLGLNQRGVRATKMTMTHGEDETPEDVVVLTGEHNGRDWKVVATWGCCGRQDSQDLLQLISTA